MKLAKALNPMRGLLIKKLKMKKVKQTKLGKKLDAAHPNAKPAGVRISKRGNKYTETRSNRAD